MSEPSPDFSTKEPRPTTPSAGPPTDPARDTVSGRQAEWPRVPGYVILSVLGRGGMGVVYKARHERLDRIVALKVVRPEMVTHADAVERFRREARMASRLAHPNLVTVYDADEAEGRHFLAMEYVEGVDLSKLVREKGPLPIAEACDYVRQAAMGLQHAHECGLVHRDVKPGNLLLSARDGRVEALDLGLARLREAEEPDPTTGELTGSGALMGTPDFMAPEQVRDFHKVDVRADLYSLGCTLYYLLTGRVPFPGGLLIEKLDKHRFESPQSVEQLRPDVSPEVSNVLRKLLAKRPEDRYQTPAELAAALDTLAGEDQPSQPVPVRPPARKSKAGRRLATLAAGIVVAGIGVWLCVHYVLPRWQTASGGRADDAPQAAGPNPAEAPPGAPQQPPPVEPVVGKPPPEKPRDDPPTKPAPDKPLEAPAPKRVPARAESKSRLLLGTGAGGYNEKQAANAFYLARAEGAANAILWLRPNTELAVFPYVVNPSEDKENLRVRLVAADGTLVAESETTAVFGKEKDKDARPRLFTFAPPPAPAAKEAPSPWVKGDGLSPQFRLELVQVEGDGDTIHSQTVVDRVPISVLVPQWYVAARAEYAAADNRLTVTVKPVKDVFAGGPCPLRLNVLLPDPKGGEPVALERPRHAIVERPLTPDQEAVELTVADPRLALLKGKAGMASQVSLTVDGYEHAFRFEGGFEGDAGLTPLNRLGKPTLRLGREAGPAGTDLSASVAVDDILPATLPTKEEDFDVALRLDLGRLTKNRDFDAIVGHNLKGHRMQLVSVNPQGPKGALALRAESRDWEVALPTKGLVGTYRLRASVPDRQDTIKSVAQDVILDDTPPEITALGLTEKVPKAGAPVELFAKGDDPESGIKEVIFFVGKAGEDGKISEGAARAPGSAGSPDKESRWVALLPVASEKAGRLDVSVMFVNGAGMKSFRTATIELRPEFKP